MAEGESGAGRLFRMRRPGPRQRDESVVALFFQLQDSHLLDSQFDRSRRAGREGVDAQIPAEFGDGLREQFHGVYSSSAVISSSRLMASSSSFCPASKSRSRESLSVNSFVGSECASFCACMSARTS